MAAETRNATMRGDRSHGRLLERQFEGHHTMDQIYRSAVLLGVLVFASPGGVFAQSTPAESLPDMLASQIRSQGFSCDKALDATMDTQLSKPDHGVWVLKCSNAEYRISRVPDMAAKVEQIR